MLRRNFLKAAAGLLGFAPVVVPNPEPAIPSHYFDWTGDVYAGMPDGPWCRTPFTTDPRYKETLDYGGTQKVLCDGVEVKDVRRCQTGEQGWVEALVRGPDGRVSLEVLDQWEGKARPADEPWVFLPQQVSPDRRDEHGNLIPRYLERVAVRVLRGRVEYIP